jgi:hypothetical protein
VIRDIDGNEVSLRVEWIGEWGTLRIDTEWADGREETESPCFSLTNPQGRVALRAFAEEIIKAVDDSYSHFQAGAKR